MGIHQLFAHNLRTGCLKFSSIAEACRVIGVNRQQFNKYLSGAMLPNARTLHRICATLNIEEWELFVPHDANYLATEKSVSELPSLLTPILSALSSNVSFKKLIATNKEASLRPGVYTCYFPLVGLIGSLVASTLQISFHQGLLTFTRHTRIASPSRKNQFLASGKHHGIILSNGTYDYLIGYNTVSPNNITFKCFPRDVTGGDGIQFGLAIIQGMSPLVACRVALKRIGTSPRIKREALMENSNLKFAKTESEKSLAQILHSVENCDSAILTLLDQNMLLFRTSPSSHTSN